MARVKVQAAGLVVTGPLLVPGEWEGMFTHVTRYDKNTWS